MATSTADTWTIVPGTEEVTDAFSSYAEDPTTPVFASPRYVRALPSGLHAVVDRYTYASRLTAEELDDAYAQFVEAGNTLPAGGRPDQMWVAIVAIDVWSNYYTGDIGDDDETTRMRIVWEKRASYYLIETTLGGEFPFTEDGARRLAAAAPPARDEEYVALTADAPAECRLT